MKKICTEVTYRYDSPEEEERHRKEMVSSGWGIMTFGNYLTITYIRRDDHKFVEA